MNNLLTKEQAMKMYGIKDLRKLKTKDFVKLMSSLDKMDPSVAKELIHQIPNCLDMVKDYISSSFDSYKETVKLDEKSLESIYASYDLLLESLNNRLNSDNISDDDIIKISTIISEIIRNKEEVHFRQQQERHEMFRSILQTVGVVAIGALGVLNGISQIKSQSSLPKYDDDYNDDYS